MPHCQPETCRATPIPNIKHAAPSSRPSSPERTYLLAHPSDLGPCWTDSDAPFPLRYRLLPSTSLTSELARQADACQPFHGLWAVSFQPCIEEEEASQDRWVAEEWDIGGRKWGFAGVLDGHAGPDTAAHAVSVLPGQIRDSLSRHVSTGGHDAASVAALLAVELKLYDDALTRDLLTLFPSEAKLAEMSDEDIARIVNDHDRGGENYAKVIRCMRGTTVTLALVDWEGRDLWVANVGDSEAILASRSPFSSAYCPLALTSRHSGASHTEAALIHASHPPSESHTAIFAQRVLGALAVTRALGDHAFKLPAAYTQRVFLSAKPGFRVHSKVQQWIVHNKTPPYVSCEAEVRHVKLGEEDKYVLLCSDGLRDLYEGMKDCDVLQEWVSALEDAGNGKAEDGGNLALRLLRAAIGGEDERRVSMNMTLELDQRWLDDTTILVMGLKR